MWQGVASYILNRLKEKSTWVALGSVLTGMGVAFSPENWQMIMTIGMGIPGIISVLIPSSVMEKNIVAADTTEPKTDIAKSIQDQIK